MPKRKKAAVKAKKKPLAKKKIVSKTKKKVVKKKVVKRKAKKVTAIPKGYHSITPYLIVNQGAKAIEFYKKVFGAKERMRMDQPDGRLGHAELLIGDSVFMLADECPEMGAKAPQANSDSPVGIHLYVKDVDAVVARAVAAGASLLRAVENMFYGDRSGSLEDPFGHRWHVATHVENVTPAMMKKRMAELFGK